MAVPSRGRITKRIKRKHWIAIGAAAGVVALVAGVTTSPGPSGPQTLYVDCVAGNDTNDGTSTTTAWRTMAQANRAELEPGDSLLFKSGCEWKGQKGLLAHWVGTETEPITIGRYATGAAPRITDAGNYGISVTGQWQIIDGFSVSFKPVNVLACGQPVGTYYALKITEGGAHNVITHNLLTTATAGLHVSASSGGFNLITANTLTGNNVMQATGDPDGFGELGAWGMLLRGGNDEISYNYFGDNRAVCIKPGYSYLFSNSVEIYEAHNDIIHHNRSVNDRVFSELGGSPYDKASDNTYEYNLVTSTMAGARFITTRGALNTEFGPVFRTTATRNTINYTGQDSQGLVCGLGCSPDILSASYNIFDVAGKAIYFDDTMTQVANMVWSHGAPVYVQDGGRLRIATGTTAELIVADPRFVNPANGNYRLRASSPAIGAGGPSGYLTDLQGDPSDTDGPDLGAYEYS